MSSNLLYGLRKVGTLIQLTGAAWPAAALACVCRLHAVAVRSAALVSDEKRIRGVFAMMRYINWQPLFFWIGQLVKRCRCCFMHSEAAVHCILLWEGRTLCRQFICWVPGVSWTVQTWTVKRVCTRQHVMVYCPSYRPCVHTAAVSMSSTK